jgi:carbonic anhydrase
MHAPLLNHASSAKGPIMNHFSELLAGYNRFRSSGWKTQRERWDELREGQSPKVMVIACSDSRVEPSQIFDTTPGEIFVVRNVGALVPPFETSPGRHGVSAALEFAVQFLKVEEIVVLGHGLCGGCHAALHRTMEGNEPGNGGFIADWISMLDDARDVVHLQHSDINTIEATRAMEFAAVRVSLDNLRSFPCIIEKEERGSLNLRGALFAISDGILHVLDEETGEFSPR